MCGYKSGVAQSSTHIVQKNVGDSAPTTTKRTEEKEEITKECVIGIIDGA